ncbi:TonB-dependent receptor domain-containing protein [Novosphingobium kaempferiae]|uniref:TonB-dependent receptor domain-containing protein n=1 Tax=Novosphingobium kaempferiae TaxID=2896849 RepID=UPI001E40DC18|nr:TonB-dependent receptor [Novosphingobium kaempferiae]
MTGFRKRILATTSLASVLAMPQLVAAAEADAQAGSSYSRVGDIPSDIVVSATGYELNVQDAPATISVITADEIKQRSYTDITDVLMNVPGVHIQGGGVEQSVMIRGMSSDYTLFLVDGKRMQDNQAFGLNGQQAGTPINFLPPLDSIERIEVIRGPASSLYGSDAIGGVINVITKKVMNDFGGSFTTEYIKSGPGNDVTNDGVNASLALNIPMIRDRLSLQVTGGLRYQDEADFVGGDDSAAADPEFKRKNIAAKLSFRLDDANTFTAGAGHTIQERTANPGKSLAEGEDATYTKTLRDNFFVTHEGDFGNLVWNSYVTYDTSKNPTRVNATTGNGIDFDTLVANTQAALQLSRHKVVGGINYFHEKLQDGATNGLNLPGFVVPTDVVTMDRKQYAAFLEDNWEIVDDLSLLLSGRVDHSENFGTRFSPKAYAVFNMTDSFTIKGGITSGYKVPSLRSAATDFGSTSMGGVIIGNPDLKPEKTMNYEAGVSYVNKGAGISASLTAYQSDFKDKLLRTGRICAQNVVCEYGGVTYPAHQFGYTTYENVDTARLRGVEWTVDWNVMNGLRYRHSYTYSETEQTSGTNKGKPLNDIPEHMFNASLDWKASRNFNLWGQLNYRGKTSGRTTNSSGSGTNDFRYPPYTFYNLGVVIKPKRDLRLNVGVYNLTNKKVTAEEGYAYVLDGRRFSASLSVDF